jgi:hypothetical protein
MISPATVPDWLQALFLAGLLGALGRAMRGALGIETRSLDDNDDMKHEERRNAA